MIDTNTEYANTELLLDTVTNGYQYIVVHKDALAIDIPLSKLATKLIADDTPTGNFLNIADMETLLGSKFVPVPKLDINYVLIHWCFDEKLIGGKSEQELLKGLFTAYGFTNIRDLNNDGINDSEIEDVDWAGDLADTSKKYFLFVSAREVQTVPVVETLEPTI